MSTYQPPGEPPSYAQPQDPWANAHETGVASAPTDPIPQSPQQAYGQFTPGVAAPSVWTQETVAHGGYEYVPQQRSRLGMYVLVILAVIVFGGGGGYGAYYLITSRNQTTTPQSNGSTSPVSSRPVTSPGQSPAVEPADIKVGDCIFNIGSATEPVMVRSDCGKAQSYKVIKILAGEQVPEGPNGTFDKDNTAPQVCSGTGYEAYFGWDSSNDANDYFFCLTTN